MRHQPLHFANSVNRSVLPLETSEAEIFERRSAWTCSTPAQIRALSHAKEDALSSKRLHRKHRSIIPVAMETTEALNRELRQVHEANICRSLSQRIQAAEKTGDRELGKILQAELETLSTCKARSA